MGMFKVRVRVANSSDPGRAFEDDFVVDTGALYTFVPAERLTAIGVVPRSQREFVFGTGHREHRPLGQADLTVVSIGETLTCPIVFGPPGALYLLGATALEIFSLHVDPLRQVLEPAVAVIGGFVVR